MIWALIVVSCLASDDLPVCASSISQNRYANFTACEDAAVRMHDQMRAGADARGQTVLLIDTRCLALSLGAPT